MILRSVNLNRARVWMFFSTCALMMVAGCAKNEFPEPETQKEPVEETGAVPFYKLQRMENLAAETDDKNPTVAKTEVLFSLEFKKEQPLSYSKTSLWDISFSGLYNSFLSANNSGNPLNTGYQGPGKGGMLILEKPFDAVTTIPSDAEFKTGKGLYGTDDHGAFGEGTGWYLYDFGGILVGNGSDDKKHVAYAMGSPLTMANGQVLPARTIVLRTAKGNYAKIKMISVYKDVFTPDKMFKNTPHMYFTFEYVIVPAGSTRFEIK